MIEIIILIVVGMIAGILTGLGLGGGALLIPILYAFQMTHKEAQVMNLAFSIPMAILGTYENSKNSLVDYKIAKKLLLFGLMGCILGSYVGKKIDSEVLKKIFGIIIFLFGIYQLAFTYKKSKGDILK